MSKIIAVTGHRPNKLGGYNIQPKLVEFAKQELALLKPKHIITGMAIGWDQAVAEACIDLAIPFIAAVPFVGQERKWPKEVQAEYFKLLGLAWSVHIISEGGYRPYKMQTRNEWMVAGCQELLALWDGSKGGTCNCVTFCTEVAQKPVINVWDRWRTFNGNKS